MKEKNIYTKAIKYFYNIPGDLTDEQYGILTTFGNNVYMALFLVIGLTFFASIYFDQDLMGYGIFFTLVIGLAKQSALVQKLGVDKLVVSASQVKTARKQMFRRSLLQTGIVALYSIIVALLLWKSGIPQESGTSPEIYFQVAFPGTVVLMTVIAFISSIISNRRKIVIQ